MIDTILIYGGLIIAAYILLGIVFTLYVVISMFGNSKWRKEFIEETRSGKEIPVNLTYKLTDGQLIVMSIIGQFVGLFNWPVKLTSLIKSYLKRDEDAG